MKKALLALILIAIVGCTPSTPTPPQTTPTTADNAEWSKETWNNHTYVIRKSRTHMGWYVASPVNDPDCPTCKQMKETNK